MTNSKLSKNGKLIKWPDTYFVLSIMSLSVGFLPYTCARYLVQCNACKEVKDRACFGQKQRAEMWLTGD